jgi:hypothetical protein
MHQTYLDLRRPDELLTTFIALTAEKGGTGRFICHFRRQDGVFEQVPASAIPGYRREHEEVLDREFGNLARQQCTGSRHRQLMAREAFAFTLAERELYKARREAPGGKMLLSKPLARLLHKLRCTSFA